MGHKWTPLGEEVFLSPGSRAQVSWLWDQSMCVHGSVQDTGVGGTEALGACIPEASNWRYWDRRAATGENERLSPAAGCTHLLHT